MKHWDDKAPFAVTVCDENGIIVTMNEKSCETFAKYGGQNLIGRNLADCHPEPARAKLNSLLAEPRTNCYTIEKNGQKKMIYQAPIYQNGNFSGLVELSLPLPAEVPHFIRKGMNNDT